MPRIIRGTDRLVRPRHPELVARLVEELRASHESGQPIIDEQRFPESGAIRVYVIWDRWDRVPDEERTDTILQAYEEAEGKETRDRIAIAVGLTVPEASESGLLPYQVLPALRKDDPFSPEQCRSAMVEEGASILAGNEKPQLRFATMEEAEACRNRLARRLPGSEPIWMIAQEVSRIAD